MTAPNAVITKTGRALEVSADGVWAFYWPVLIPGDPTQGTGADSQGHIVTQKTIDAMLEKYQGKALRCDLNHKTAPVPHVDVELVKTEGDVTIGEETVISGTLMGKVVTDNEHLASFLRKAGNGLSLYGEGRLTPLENAMPAPIVRVQDDENPECPKCGTPIPQGETKCPKCGAVVEGPQDQGEPLAKYSWDECIKEQTESYGDESKAYAVCTTILGPKGCNKTVTKADAMETLSMLIKAGTLPAPPKAEEEPEDEQADDEEDAVEEVVETPPEQDLMAVALEGDIKSAVEKLQIPVSNFDSGPLPTLQAWFDGLGKGDKNFDACCTALGKAEGFQGDPRSVCAYLSLRAKKPEGTK